MPCCPSEWRPGTGLASRLATAALAWLLSAALAARTLLTLCPVDAVALGEEGLLAVPIRVARCSGQAWRRPWPRCQAGAVLPIGVLPLLPVPRGLGPLLGPIPATALAALLLTGRR